MNEPYREFVTLDKKHKVVHHLGHFFLGVNTLMLEKLRDAEEAATRWFGGEDVLPWNKTDKAIKTGRNQTIIRYPSSFEGTELFETEGWGVSLGQSYANENGRKASTSTN